MLRGSELQRRYEIIIQPRQYHPRIQAVAMNTPLRQERRQMISSRATTRAKPNLLGIAADHGGFPLKQHLLRLLRATGRNVKDFGSRNRQPKDDYSDVGVPLARAVVCGQIHLGVAICDTGVGAAIAANKVPGVRACLIHEAYYAHHGVADDSLNLICVGGLVVGHATARELGPKSHFMREKSKL